MAVGTISSVITKRFVQNLEFARAGETPTSLSGAQATKVTLSGLQLGSKVFSNAIRGLNNVYNFIDFTEADLTKLSKITGDMIDVVERATKNGIGANARAGLNSKFEDLTSLFKKVIEDSSRGDYSDISTDDIAAIFQSVGLSKDNSDQLASIVNSFIVSKDEDGKEVLASDESQARRPVRIPAAAYTSTATGVGDGTFAPAISVEGGRLASVLGDVNNDTFLDVIGVNASSTGIVITLGNGDGTFKAPINDNGYLSTQYAQDIDGDSNIDLIGLSGTSIAVRLGNGDGTFDAQATYDNVGASSQFHLTNIDADPELELIGKLSPTELAIFQSNSDGSFDYRTIITLSAAFSGISDIKSGDYNGDGETDLIIADDRFGASTTDPGRVQILYGNGDGSFFEPVTIDTGDAGGISSKVDAADYNNDGFLDIGVFDTDSNKFFVRLGNNDGTFDASTSYNLTGSNQLTSTDLNGDGYADIASAGNGHLSIMLGNGDGTFKAEKTYSSGATGVQIQIGDLNGDAINDIVMSKDASDSFSYFQGERTANYGSVRDFKTLFASGRTIRSRAGAYLMLADLKALKQQLDTNLEAIGKAKTFVFQNIQLASATGFAFLETAQSASAKTQNDPDTIVAQLRQKLRRADAKAISQISNLDPITTAALTTTY